MKTLAVILVFVLALQKAAEAQCYSTNNTFNDGEDISYTVWYKLGPLWFAAGTAKFIADSTMYNGRESWRIKSVGSTFEEWDSYFKVRDMYEVYMERELLRPLEFNRKTYEGGLVKTENYRFDHQSQLIYSSIENNEVGKVADTVAMKSCTHDILTAIYYSRNYDFGKCKVNQKIPIMVLMDAEFYPMYIRYLGTERIKDREDVEYDCLKFSVMLAEGSMFNSGENMTVWVTNDGNRIPILIEADIIVGTIKAYLTSYKNIRHPFDAKVK